MTRVQFLNDLYRRLGALSREEAEQHLTYYAEMLADRMEEGMTEEEAVASMEDVDTIAGRILQDAGISPESGCRPPVDTGEIQPEKPRRRWVKPLAILVTAALALAVVTLAVPIILFSVNVVGSREDIAAPQDVTYVAVEGGEEVAYTAVENEDAVVVVPDEGITGITGTVVDSGGSVVDVVGGTYIFTGDGIRDINIEWVNGAVVIETSEGDDFVFTESATGELDEAEKLTYTLRNGELTIHFCREGRKNVSETKNLTVRLPASVMLNELEVDTVSAAVDITDVNAGAIDLETTSGDCLVAGAYSRVSAATVSGNVTLQGDIASVEMESTSGSLLIERNHVLDYLEADTVSGDVRLELPAEKTFDLHYETVSGELDSGQFALKHTPGGNYSIGGGGSSRLEVDTVSGDLYLVSEE